MIPPGLKTWRKLQLRRKYPNGKVSAHFRHIEFWTHDGTPIPASDKNLKGLERHCRILLEPMRKKFGACHILSGYRHKAYNASIGGASQSYHIWDLDDQHRDAPATDLTFATGDPAKWGAYARSLMIEGNKGNGGVGVYPRSGFVHVDLRNYPSSWAG